LLHRATLEDYSLEIIGRCQAGQARCKRLLAADFASDAPHSLAQTLLNVFGYLARVAVVIPEKIDWSGPDNLIEKATENLRTLDWQVKEFGSHIRYVESARTDRLPWQVIPSFEKLVELLRPGAKVMLRPMWHYNYATIVSDLRELYLHELQEYEYYIPDFDVESNVVFPLGSAFHIISFPSLERDNILLHSVIGHELGHLIASELVERSKKDFLDEVQSQIEAATDSELARQDLTEESAPLWYEQIRTTRLTENSKQCLNYWERAMEEILADVVGALLFGPAALFSSFDIAVQSGFDLAPSERNEYYPPWRLRIREVLRIVDEVAKTLLSVKPDWFRMTAPMSLAERAKDLGLDRDSRSGLVNDRIKAVRDTATVTSDEKAINRNPLAAIAYSVLRRYIDIATAEIKLLIGARVINEKQLLITLPVLIERLDSGVPPNAEHDMPSRKLSKIGLVDVLNSAWYHKASLTIAPTAETDRELLEGVRSQRNRLTLKAIEYAHLAEEHPIRSPRQAPTPRPSSATGVLTSDDIHEAMERSAVLDRIILTPLFDARQSLVDAALDVRLGTEFILFRKEAFDALNICSTETIVSNIGRYQERVVRRIQQPFVLHPRQLIIGSTLEYIQLPPTVMAYVIGKSTWGRTGLVIATATKVDPGFRGCITLEIINEGEVPLVLYPGIPIAQLVFHRTERPNRYSGTYTCPIGPEFPQFTRIVDAASFWLPKRRK
jgi:dCTP deaminase